MSPLSADEFDMLVECLGDCVLSSRMLHDDGVLILKAETPEFRGGLGASKYVAQWLDAIGLEARNFVSDVSPKSPMRASVYRPDGSGEHYASAYSVQHEGTPLGSLERVPGKWLPWGVLGKPELLILGWGLITGLLSFGGLQQFSGGNFSTPTKVAIAVIVLLDLLAIMLYLWGSIGISIFRVLYVLGSESLIAYVCWTAYHQPTHLSPVDLLQVLLGLTFYLFLWAALIRFVTPRVSMALKAILTTVLALGPFALAVRLINNSLLDAVGAAQFEVPLNEFSIAAVLAKPIIFSLILLVGGALVAILAYSEARRSFLTSGLLAMFGALIIALSVVIIALGVLTLGDDIAQGREANVSGVVQRICYKSAADDPWVGPVIALGKFSGDRMFVLTPAKSGNSPKVTALALPSIIAAPAINSQC